MSKQRRKKLRKYRGNKTGYGCKKKHRGGGSRGGRGKAGMQKHKRSLVTNKSSAGFGKQGMKSIYLKDKPKVINLSVIDRIISKKNLKEIDLSDYKVLSTGKLSKGVKIKAHSFSEKALGKIKKAGGTAEALHVRPEPKPSIEPKESEKVEVKEAKPKPVEKVEAKPEEKPSEKPEQKPPEKSKPEVKEENEKV